MSNRFYDKKAIGLTVLCNSFPNQLLPPIMLCLNLQTRKPKVAYLSKNVETRKVTKAPAKLESVGVCMGRRG